jgi:hypothetical protein
MLEPRDAARFFAHRQLRINGGDPVNAIRFGNQAASMIGVNLLTLGIEESLSARGRHMDLLGRKAHRGAPSGAEIGLL